VDKLWFIGSIAAGLSRLFRPKHGLVTTLMAFIYVRSSPAGERSDAAREAMYAFLDKPVPARPETSSAELPELTMRQAGEPADVENADAVRQLRSTG
jgi:hypothetical protein